MKVSQFPEEATPDFQLSENSGEEGGVPVSIPRRGDARFPELAF